MKMPNRTRSAFTMIELFAVIVVVFILLSVFMPPLTHDKAKASKIKCVNNLKNVGLAYRIYATDHGNLFPWESKPGMQSRTNFALADLLQFTLIVSNELSTARIMSCPADRRAAATNWTDLTSVKQLGYFLGMNSSEKLPQSFLSGDRNATNESGSLELGVRKVGYSRGLRWDSSIHQNQGNAAMGDGSVQQLSSARLRDQVLTALPNTNATMTWLVP